MKRGAGTLAILVGVMLLGGVVTAGLAGGVPIIIQSTDPNASPFEATPQQAGQFVFWIFFVLSNVIVVGGILAGIFYLGSREVKRAKEMPILSERNSE